MSKVPAVQNLPPLSSIKDPAVRNYLQVLTDGWRVRNGEVGDGNEKFLTVADLTEASSAVQIDGSSTTASNKTLSNAKNKVTDAYRKIMDDILNSKLWKLLETRIERIERPEWFDKKFGTKIKEWDEIVETKTSALARRVTQVGANLNNNIAMVNEEITTLVTAQSATASQVTTLATQFNNNVSYVQQQLTSISTAQGTQASAITTLQSDVANSSVAAQQAFTLAQGVDGQLDTAWSVKVDANGYVAGFGFGVDGKAGSYNSQFYVRANTFAVGEPGSGQTIVPFIVQGGKTLIHNIHFSGAPLVTGSVPMSSGATSEVSIYHGLGKFVIPVIAWNSPPAASHAIVVTYVDQSSFRFVMYASTGSGGYTGTVSYALSYV